MSKDQKDLELKANELGKELDDNEIEAASGGVYVYDCGRNGDDINRDAYDRFKDDDDSQEQSCGGKAIGFKPDPGPIRRCGLCTVSGYGTEIG
jgi:hypothetical protein